MVLLAYTMAYHPKPREETSMTVLTPAVRSTIRNWYFGDDTRIKVTIAGYVRRHYGDQGWHGDTCGCPDDRCIGYHHDEHDECHCLPALLDAWVLEQRADLEAAPIWAAYRAALAANEGGGDADALLSAVQAAEQWVETYHGAGVVSFSLDAVVDERNGISLRHRWNDRAWLVWAAPKTQSAAS